MPSALKSNPWHYTDLKIIPSTQDHTLRKVEASPHPLKLCPWRCHRSRRACLQTPPDSQKSGSLSTAA